jgi:hypothetical protein
VYLALRRTGADKSDSTLADAEPTVAQKSGRNAMRLAMLLAAASALWVQPASAATVVYGLAFDRTYTFINPDHGGVGITLGVRNPSGTFSFDTATNQLLSFDVDPGFPPDQDFSSQVLGLFAAAGPCDLLCFIGSIDGSAWHTTISDYVALYKTTLYFGAPLDGQAIAKGGPAELPFDIADIGGTYRVNGPVPEPATWAMMLFGFLAVGALLRRRKRQPAWAIS